MVNLLTTVCKHQASKYLSVRLQNVGARHGDDHVELVDDEQRLVHALVGECCQVVCHVDELIERRTL